MTLTDLLLQIGGSAVVALGSILSYRAATRGKRIEVEAAPYGALAERVDHLEDQVGILYRERHEDRNYIRALLSERPRTLPLPQPTPAWITHPTSSLTPTSIIQPPIRPKE